MRTKTLPFCFAAVSIFVAVSTTPAFAQFGGGGNNNNNAGGAGGVTVDADGVISVNVRKTTSSKLAKRRMMAAAIQHLPTDINQPCKFRLVSLPALEEECQRLLTAGEKFPTEVYFLAGLYRVDHVFLYPETGDIVLAGPAGPFAPDVTGRMANVDTGRPTLILDDLLVALRSDGNLGCSIDPVPERLAKMLQWASANNNAVSLPIAQRRYLEMAKIMGNQTVRTWGIPEDSHFARALVEADYRMKTISIGAERTGVRGVKSHLALVKAGSNSIQRWWFAPRYDSIERNEDSTAWSFSGQRVHVLAQEEVSDNGGNRSPAPNTRESTKKFSQNFTKHFPELAAKIPVFAELQNLIDLTMVNAVIRQANMLKRANWDMALFGDAERSPTVSLEVPKQTRSIANTKVVGRRLVIGLVSGGVTIHSSREVSRKVKVNAKLDAIQPVRNADQKTNWWWDAESKPATP